MSVPGFTVLDSKISRVKILCIIILLMRSFHFPWYTLQSFVILQHFWSNGALGRDGSCGYSAYPSIHNGVEDGVVTLALLSPTLFIFVLSLINDLWSPFCEP